MTDATYEGVAPSQRSPLGTVGKVGLVLDLFAREKPEWGVREVALRLGMSRSTAHSVLSSLAAIQLLQRTPTSRYRLGWRIMQLAGGVTEATVLRRAAPAKMRKLAELGQSTHLAVWDGRDMFFFARAVALKGVAMATAAPGTTLPAHATASGKILLGHLRSEASLARMLDGTLTRLTDRTIVDEGELWHEVASARESGLAVSREETVEDVDALAVPVRGTDGRVVAALGVSVRAGELDGYLACNRQHVLATAAALSAEVRRMTSEVVARSTIRGLAVEV